MEGEKNNLVYGACVRNYAAELGRYVLDGCGEFARDSVGSRYCEACGCDKNFHFIIPVATDGTKLAIHGGNNGGRILRQSTSEESVLTMVTDDDDDDDDDKVKVEVNNTPPGNVDEGSTATSGSKKKQNKNKKK